MSDHVLKHRSGRVIALGRTVLAAIFLFAIWADSSQPAVAPAETYAMLIAYVAIAAAIALITWDNWWLDAKLAAPAHVLDIVVYTLLILTSDGYTSPFFLFFVFLVLSSAMRWGWRETAATAISLTVLYLGAGLIVSAAEGGFELYRFIIRSGHLIILSGILVWFGVNQGFTGVDVGSEQLFPEASLSRSPFETALTAAIQLTAARSGLLLWRGSKGDYLKVVANADGTVSSSAAETSGRMAWDKTPFLFDMESDRALAHGRERRSRFFRASEAVDPALAAEAAIRSGLAMPLQMETGRGLMLLGGIDGLSTDYVELGQHLAGAIASHIQQHALLSAVEQSAVAGARLGLSRDLHDSIVQFLAGASFRIEAISRAATAGSDVGADLRELKQLLLEEQQELRSAIGTMRKEEVALPQLAKDLQTLCGRLARQWNIGCSFSAAVPDEQAPMRIHLDAHQLVREAVANAVRHAGAQSIRVAISAEDSSLLLEVANEAADGESLVDDMPRSLRERVDEANGTLMFASRDGTTTVSVTLPLTMDAR